MARNIFFSFAYNDVKNFKVNVMRLKKRGDSCEKYLKTY
jgi:hypothetical protein